MKTVYVTVSSVLLAVTGMGAVSPHKESGGLVITPETAEIVVDAGALKIEARTEQVEHNRGAMIPSRHDSSL